MGMTYKNATITIAASSAADVTEGFLSLRPEKDHCQLTLLLPGGACGSFMMAPPIYAYVPNDPLQLRGWALQESLLSPRLLSYGEKEVVWHCQSERFKQITHSYLNYFEKVKRLPPNVFENKSPRKRHTCKQQAELWSSVVYDYSGRHLTLPEDRLPALAGIAQELANCWGDVYIAGMWKNCLIYLLGWYRPRYIEKSKLEVSKYAPSWSWASVYSQVEFHLVVRPDAEVLQSSVQPLWHQALYGEVKCGRLEIRAKVISATAVDDATTKWWFFYFDTEAHQSHEDIYYLLLGQDRKKDSRGIHHHIGLILHLTEAKTFRRVGMIYYCDGAIWLLATSQTISIT
jgi:hypothetical protein